jgi:hypothetical protein
MKQKKKSFSAIAIPLIIISFEPAAFAGKDSNRSVFKSYHYDFPAQRLEVKHTEQQEKKFKFDIIGFDPDTIILDDIFHMVEFKRVGENFSMGVTEKGLKMCIDW